MVAERVAGRDTAGRCHPQDLAAERAAALRPRAVLAVPGAGEQLTVGAEDEPAPVVVHVHRDAGQDEVAGAEPPVGVPHPDNAVVAVRG